MSEIQKYREKLIQIYILDKDNIEIKLEEILDSFDESIEELEIKDSTHEELVSIFGSPDSFVKDYVSSRDINHARKYEVKDSSVRQLRTREPKYLETRISQNALMSIVFIPYLLQYLSLILLLSIFPRFGSTGIISPFFSYINPFGLFLSSRNWGSYGSSYLLFNRLANIWWYLLTILPFLCELISGISAYYILDRKHSLKLRNMFRIIYFAYELSLFIPLIIWLIAYPEELRSGWIYQGPWLFVFEMIIIIRTKYLHPIDDPFMNHRFYKIYIFLTMSMATVMGYYYLLPTVRFNW